MAIAASTSSARDVDMVWHKEVVHKPLLGAPLSLLASSGDIPSLFGYLSMLGPISHLVL